MSKHCNNNQPSGFVMLLGVAVMVMWAKWILLGALVVGGLYLAGRLHRARSANHVAAMLDAAKVALRADYEDAAWRAGYPLGTYGAYPPDLAAGDQPWQGYNNQIGG